MSIQQISGDYSQIRGRGRNGYFNVSKVFAGDISEEAGCCYIESKRGNRTPPIVQHGNKENLIKMFEQIIDELKKGERSCSE